MTAEDDYASGGLMLNDGTAAAGVSITGFHRYTDLAVGCSPTGGTAPDQALMSYGVNMTGFESSAGTTGAQQSNNFKIEGLDSVFPNGYRVISYQEAQGLFWHESSGYCGMSFNTYASPNLADWSYSVTTVGVNWNTANTVSNWGIFDAPGTGCFGVGTCPGTVEAQFDGDYTAYANGDPAPFAVTVDNNGEVIDAPDLVVTFAYDDIDVTGIPYPNMWEELLWTGVQFVGDTGPPIPEPAGLGLLALSLLAMRRRRS